MITYPIAKINLGLNVVARRPDGYHDLETVFAHKQTPFSGNFAHKDCQSWHTWTNIPSKRPARLGCALKRPKTALPLPLMAA